MNSFEYIEVSVRLEPFSEETAEMLMADLAELPYDSFLTEEPVLKAYIPLSEYRPGDLKVVLSGYPDVAGFEAVPIQGQNWNKEWESRFEPIVVDGKVTIKASFNENVPRTRFNIWIDPEMAFGTGSHNTTYMMMQRMLGIESLIRDHVVLDMGCGTAILGILAAKMDARKVFAVDIDAVAARSAWGNARWNRVSRRVETACGGEHPPEHPAGGHAHVRAVIAARRPAPDERILRGRHPGLAGTRFRPRPHLHRPDSPRRMGLRGVREKLIIFAILSAGVLELVDNPDLGSGGASRGGSSPPTRTRLPN